jgi:hypothetical protein
MKRRKRTLTRSLWEGLEGLHGPQLRLKLLERMASSEDAQQRFWKPAKIENESDCWIYNQRSKGRYSVFSMISPDRYRSVGIGAHRVSYFLTHGTIPKRAFVCHRCDNPKCVNPNHLFLGDKYSNMLDRDSKNRQAKGEQIGLHKLTEEQVIWARKRYADGGINYTEIGKILKVDYTTISRAVNRNTWKHVK